VTSDHTIFGFNPTHQLTHDLRGENQQHTEKFYFSNKLTFDAFETFVDYHSQWLINPRISDLSVDSLRSVGNTWQPWCDHEEKYFTYF